MLLSSSIKIDRKIDEVFDFVSTVENMARWVSGVSGARLLSPHMGKGARFVADYTSAWRKNPVEFEVLEYEEPTLFGMEVARGPFPFRGRLKLKTANGGTEVTNEIEADPDSLSSQLATITLGRFLRGLFTDRLERELMALDQAITGRASLA